MPKHSASNVTKVKTPGDTAEPTGGDTHQDIENQEEALDAAVQDVDDVALADAKPRRQKVTLTLEQVQEMINDGVAKGLAQHRAASGGQVAPAKLPDQSEIDANTIRKPVLTLQGYVVPPKMGATPEHLRNLDA